MCAESLPSTCPKIAIMLKQSVKLVQKYAMLVLKNARAILIWITVNSVLKPVENVLTSVEGCLAKLAKQDGFVYLFCYITFLFFLKLENTKL
jgi:hypothetical protein